MVTKTTQAFLRLNEAAEIVPLARVLQSFYQQRPTRSVQSSNGSALQVLVEALLFDSKRCIPEFRLVMDPSRACGNGKFGFADLFIPPAMGSVSPRALIIELKNVTLEEISNAGGGTDLEELRELLKTDSEHNLLQTKYK
jgi:hypothetical protein